MAGRPPGRESAQVPGSPGRRPHAEGDRTAAPSAAHTTISVFDVPSCVTSAGAGREVVGAGAWATTPEIMVLFRMGTEMPASNSFPSSPSRMGRDAGRPSISCPSSPRSGGIRAVLGPSTAGRPPARRHP